VQVVGCPDPFYEYVGYLNVENVDPVPKIPAVAKRLLHKLPVLRIETSPGLILLHQRFHVRIGGSFILKFVFPYQYGHTYIIGDGVILRFLYKCRYIIAYR